MKSWAFAAIFISVGALAACDDSGTGGSGNSGGGGGSGGTGGGATTTTTTSVTTGGPMVCDTGDPSGASCGDTASGCVACALGGDCSDELATCQADQTCVDFANCIDPCMDQTCFDDCTTQFPAGADIYNNILLCVFCDQCFVDCDGASAGCM